MFLTFSEGVFFSSIAIIFFLVVSIFYYFKRKVETLEKNNETLGDICKTIVLQIENNKLSHHHNTPKYPTHDVNTGGSHLQPTNSINNTQHQSDHHDDDDDDDHDHDDHDDDDDDDDDTSDSDTNTTERHYDGDEQHDNISNHDSSLQEIVVQKLDESIPQEYSHITDFESFSEQPYVNTNDNTDENVSIIEDDLENQSTKQSIVLDIKQYDRTKLQKMTVQMLRTIIIQNNLSIEEYQSMKKKELVDAILIFI